MDDTRFALEDEKDVLNDETFGDDGEDYTWDGEDKSENLFDFGLGEGNKGRESGTNRPWPKAGQAVSPFHDNLSGDYEDQDGGYTNVEESISRLVLEDDDIEDERDRIIKASHRSLMPPQVITRNLNWFTEKDVGSQLFSSPIWSMHPTDVLQGTPVQVPPALNQDQPIPYRPPPGLHLEEKRSGIRTLQDIEDELHLTAIPVKVEDSSIPLPDHQPTLPFPGPPRVDDAIRGTAQNLGRGRGMISQAPGPPPPGLQEHFMQQQRGSRPMPPFPYEQNLRHPWPGPGGPPPMMFPGHGRARNINVGPPRPPGPLDMRMMDPRLRHRMPMMQGMRPPPHGQGPPNMIRGPQQYFRFRPNMDFMGKINTGYNAPPRPRYHSGDLNGSDDNLVGLMTEQDKQRLRNIQILQLQNDHPYTTDYYCQMKAFSQNGNIGHLKKVFPSRADRQRKNKYTPAVFENALGKLQTVSALAPKRVMDTVLKVSTQSTHGQNSRARLWQEIERVYMLYLNCRELSCRRRANTLNDENNPLPEFVAYTRILYAFDKQGDNIYRWLVCRKGRELFMKLIPQFLEYRKGQEAAYMILANMLKYSTVRSMRRMESKPGFRQYCELIDDMVKAAGHYLIDLLLQSVHMDLWKTCFGCTVGLMILDRAAEYELNQTVVVDWSSFNNALGPTLPNLRISDNNDFLPGFERFPSILKIFLKFDTQELGTPLEIVNFSGENIDNVMLHAPNMSLQNEVLQKRLIFKELQRRSLNYEFAECDSE